MAFWKWRNTCETAGLHAAGNAASADRLQLGKQTLLRRREATVQERIRSLLLEQTRTPVPNPKEEIKLKEGDTTYTIRRSKLELSDRDGQAVQGLFEIRVTAEWLEGRELQQATAETWVFPPLFEP